MIRIVPRPRCDVRQDLFPSVSAAFEHFRQTGESVFESNPSNSYDFSGDEDVTKVDLDAVPRDTSLVEAFLMNHGEKSRQELNPAEPTPAEPTPAEPTPAEPT